MDGSSHYTVAYVLLDKCNLDTNYAHGWCSAPDLDLNTWLHRYKRHRFSVLPRIYTEFRSQYGEDALLPTTDKTAIAVSIVSHFYLDMFNGWILCWGITPPAINVPLEIAKEYREFNLLLQKDQSAVDELQVRTEQVFRTQLPDTIIHANELLSTLINELHINTPFFTRIARFKVRAYEYVSDFVGEPIGYTNLYTNLTTAYYNMLNKFYKEY